MKIRDRIKELRRVKASDLVPHPKNWRVHPQKQARLLQGVFREIGYADALLAREDSQGRLHLIDGHLRAETTPDQEVPVLVLDLTEEEADKLLAVLDPLANMAETDGSLLKELIEGMDAEDETLRSYFNEIRHGEDFSDENLKDKSSEKVIPELYQIVIECLDEEDQRVWFEKLSGEGCKCRLLNL